MSDHAYPVLTRREVFRGAVFTVVSDEVGMPAGGVARRDVIRHAGAVAMVALDSDDRVVLLRQYRHALGVAIWEIPAGLMDVPGESDVQVAIRELAEEADLMAARWDLLVEVHTSPGISDELVRVFLARGLTPVPDGVRYRREHEEADLVVAWVGLDEAVAMIFRGEITNGPTMAGILATAHARDAGWAPLRDAAAGRA